MAELSLPPGYRLDNNEGRQAYDEIATIWKSWFSGLIDTDDIPTLEHNTQQKYELPRQVLHELSKAVFTVCFEEWHRPQQEPTDRMN